MKKLYSLLRKSFNKEIDGTGLAVFRIFYSCVLLCEIAQIFYFRHLIYDKIPYVSVSEINFIIPITLWGIVVVFFMFGLFTKFTSILNYLLTLILVGSLESFEYHVFYAYLGINFLIIFFPMGRCLSLDRLITKLKFSNTTFQYNPPRNVSQLYYFLIIYIGLALVYFDSVFFKVSSNLWYRGLGFWEPSSLPMVTRTDMSWILNQEILVKIIGYGIIVFEFVFIFLFFRKKWRVPLAIIGVLMHIGIMIQFPIPWFGLTACAIYCLMVPVSFWKKLFGEVAKEETKLYVYYDAECPLCVRTKITVKHFDVKNRIKFKTVQFDAVENDSLKGIATETMLNDIHSVNLKGKVFSGVDTYIQIMNQIWYLKPISLALRLPGFNYFSRKIYSYVAQNRTTERCTEENCGYDPPAIPDDSKFKIFKNFTLKDLNFKFIYYISLFFTVLQLFLLYNSNFVGLFKGYTGSGKTEMSKMISQTVSNTRFVTCIFFGSTHHVVFNDSHFDNYNHIVAITYLDKNGKETWLPINDERGMPSTYCYGFNWVKWTFRVTSPDIETKTLGKGIRRFTAFWANKNGIDLNDATFLIKVKKIDIPNKWEKDFLKKQIASPWIDGGKVEWKYEEFYQSIKNIESL